MEITEKEGDNDMAKIIDHILVKKEKLKEEAEARANQEKAQAAIIGGMQSNAWREYMLQFCTEDNGQVNDVQLRRLTGKDNSPEKARNRAYLVANGMCGDFTKEHFEENVKSIDEGLGGANCEPT
jgi:hypothetical protein